MNIQIEELDRLSPIDDGGDILPGSRVKHLDSTGSVGTVISRSEDEVHVDWHKNPPYHVIIERLDLEFISIFPS